MSPEMVLWGGGVGGVGEKWREGLERLGKVLTSLNKLVSQLQVQGPIEPLEQGTHQATLTHHSLTSSHTLVSKQRTESCP